jgi:hypothetical protein
VPWHWPRFKYIQPILLPLLPFPPTVAEPGSWRCCADFGSFVARTPEGGSKSRRELESKGDSSWWKAAGIYKRLISKNRKLMEAVKDKAVQLTAKHMHPVTPSWYSCALQVRSFQFPGFQDPSESVQ